MNKKIEMEKLNDQQPDYFEAVLSKEQFREFYDFLNVIKSEFSDFCIKNGEFRARNNERSIIVETGFSYLTNIDFCIIDINELVRAIYTSMPRLTTKNKFVFIDSISTITLHKPLSETLRFSEFYKDQGVGRPVTGWRELSA